MWCTRWYLPLLLLPFPTAPPFFLLVLLFSLTLHARPCLYCIVLLVALFTSSCYWAPTPLDIPSHALESIYPSLATSRPTLDLQSLLNAPPEPTASTAAPTPRLTYSARLERPKRCWCAPHQLFEPFNLTRWEQRSSVLVFVKQGFWDKLLDEEIEQETETTKDDDTSSSNPEQTTDSADPALTKTPDASSPTPSSTLWRTKWNALSSYFSRSVEQKDSAPKLNSDILHQRPETKSKPPVRAPVDPLIRVGTVTPSATTTSLPTATATEAAASAETPASKDEAQLSWWQKQYDLRPYGGGVIVDFRWGRG